MEVGATGRYTFRQGMEGFFGMVYLEQLGSTADWLVRDWFIEGSTWSDQPQRSRPGIPPGPGDFHGLTPF